MATVFTKIIKGEIPSYKVAEDEHFYAFLDINPNALGHTLVVPKVEVDKFFDLDQSTYESMMVFVRKVAKAIEQVVPCNRVGMSVIGLEVPHAHVHLIPMQSESDMFFQNKKHFTPDEMQQVADSILNQFKH